MVEPKRESSDVPEYSTYPAPAPGEDQIDAVHARYPEVGTAPTGTVTEGRWSGTESSWSGGSGGSRAMGRVIHFVRDAGERVRMRFRSAQNGIRSSSAQDWKRQAQENVQQARVKLEDTLHKYPMQTLAAIAGASFALGLAIRLSRRN